LTIDCELELFKTTINLSEFAARGYALDRRASSVNSAVMRHPDGDKIVIARNEASGAWVYFSVRDDRDNGTIIDFVQNRDGGSLGEVRKTLRAWLGSSRPAVAPSLFTRDLAPGGVKGLWHSAVKPSDFWLVLTENAIDALSFQVMGGGDGARYMATGGALNPQQPALLRGAMSGLRSLSSFGFSRLLAQF
jgi:hypothetical protein